MRITAPTTGISGWWSVPEVRSTSSRPETVFVFELCWDFDGVTTETWNHYVKHGMQE